MTNKPLTKAERHALDPHDRLDKMSHVFTALVKRLDKIQATLTQRNQHLEQWSQDLHGKMGDLETSIAHAPRVEHVVVLEIDQLRQQLTPLKESLEDMGAEIVLIISAELGENGKPKYTNDRMRKSAERLALRTSEGYQEAMLNLRALEYEIFAKQGELEEVQRQDKANSRLYAGYRSRLDNFSARF